MSLICVRQTVHTLNLIMINIGNNIMTCNEDGEQFLGGVRDNFHIKNMIMYHVITVQMVLVNLLHAKRFVFIIQ